MTTRLLALAVGAGATIFLVACGNSTPSHRTTTTHDVASRLVESTSTSSTTTSVITSTTGATTTTTTTTTAGATVCNRISASAGQMMGAAGTITGVITLTNSGPTTCVMNGYPVLALYSGTGARPRGHHGERAHGEHLACGQRSADRGLGSAGRHGTVQLPVLRRPGRIRDELSDLGDG